MILGHNIKSLCLIVRNIIQINNLDSLQLKLLQRKEKRVTQMAQVLNRNQDQALIIIQK